MTYKEQCKTNLWNLHQYAADNKLDDKSKQFVIDYMEEGNSLLETGYFDSDGLLKNAKWLKYNFRFGDNSITGTINEIASIAIWNNQPHNINNHNRMTLEMSCKEAEVNGIDLSIYQPSWKNVYNVQVKSLSMYNNSVSLYKDYFKYDTNKVDRLVLTDYKSNTLIHFSYENIKKYYEIKGQPSSIKLNDLFKDNREYGLRYSKMVLPNILS